MSAGSVENKASAAGGSAQPHGMPLPKAAAKTVFHGFERAARHGGMQSQRGFHGGFAPRTMRDHNRGRSG